MFSNIDDEISQSKWFQSHFNCTLERITHQRMGCATDFKITQIRSPSKLDASVLHGFVEFKFDKASKRTGNLYLETRQTIDFGHSYRPSGINLAVDQSTFIVFSVPDHTQTCHYMFTSVEMQELLNRKLRVVRTANCRNGNLPGVWTYGKLLPRTSVEAFKITQTKQT